MPRSWKALVNLVTNEELSTKSQLWSWVLSSRVSFFQPSVALILQQYKLQVSLCVMCFSLERGRGGCIDFPTNNSTFFWFNWLKKKNKQTKTNASPLIGDLKKKIKENKEEKNHVNGYRESSIMQMRKQWAWVGRRGYGRVGRRQGKRSAATWADASFHGLWEWSNARRSCRTNDKGRVARRCERGRDPSCDGAVWRLCHKSHSGKGADKDRPLDSSERVMVNWWRR